MRKGNKYLSSYCQIRTGIQERGLASETMRRLKKNKGAIIGLIFMVLLVVVTIASGTYDYEKTS